LPIALHPLFITLDANHYSSSLDEDLADRPVSLQLELVSHVTADETIRLRGAFKPRHAFVI
jgi:hypothetical protein